MTATTPPTDRPAPPRRFGASWLAWGLLVVVVGAVLVVGTVRDPGPQTPQDRVTAIARTIKCPTCQGEAVSDSNAAVSREIRVDIAARVAAGESDDQIRSYYVSTYGGEILLTPSSSGVGALVWVLPVVVVVVAAAGLVLVFRRWRTEPTSEATDDDRAVVARAINDRGDEADR